MQICLCTYQLQPPMTLDDDGANRVLVEPLTEDIQAPGVLGETLPLALKRASVNALAQLNQVLNSCYQIGKPNSSGSSNRIPLRNAPDSLNLAQLPYYQNLQDIEKIGNR
jgi:hypothetical protein